jgi:molybdenum ABC transporter molybdate-binding protein
VEAAHRLSTTFRIENLLSMMYRPWLAFLGSVALFAGLVALLIWEPGSGKTSGQQPLLVYCAAGMKEPVTAIARDYEARYGVEVQLQFGGSQTLLAGIEISGRGDLYVAADEGYLRDARDRNLLDETLDLARMRAVLAVPIGNPKSLHTLADLLRPDVRIACADPDAAAIGKATREALGNAGKWAAFQKHVTVFKPTVTEVANDVQPKLGSVDAGIVWDATVKQVPGLEAVSLPELAGATVRVSLGVLRVSTQPAAALRFARFLAARDAGLPVFREYGFTVIDGDRWEETPELRLLAGAMLRPAIEQTITDFEQREGVRVTRVYNGCGILVAQMRTDGHSPDAYFACDQSFMDQVHDLFLDPAPVSANRLVILVLKGNPHGIHSLDDLAKPGLRVGVGHERQCALGVVTQQTLAQSGSRSRIMSNVTVQLPTGDMLVNELLIGSLDAVIAYVSNAAEASDRLEAIAVNVPCAVAVQPLAVGRDSDFKHLARRLADALRSAESRRRFEAYGFRWKDGTP